MFALRDLQQSLSAALIGGEPSDVEAHIVADDLAPRERLDIYRNTFLATLTAALRLSFPAVQRLVGAEFFEGAARHFIERHPPQSAYLNLYGAEFADFLKGFPPAAPLAYLANVARLEWAVNCALHAREAPPLVVARLSEHSDSLRVRFIAHPSVSFVHSAFPVDDIWRAVLAGGDSALEKIDLAAGTTRLMIARPGDAVEVMRLGEFEWRFTEALCAGESLASAFSLIPNGDASAMLARHLASGLFIDFQGEAK